MSKTIGYCRLCGQEKELSDEHIPPRKAFNDKQVTFETMQDALGFSGRKYSKFRNGITRQSICESCNNLTGAWYGTAFVEWTRQGYVWLEKLENRNALLLPYNIMPLNVIKQIVVMMLAMSSFHKHICQDDLRRFAFNRTQKYLPPNFRIYMYFNKGGKPRFTDQELVIFRADLGAIDYVNAEIALPPFGYCVTSTSRKGIKSLAEHQGLYDITRFAHFDYNVWTTVYLTLPIRETHEPFPLDYRHDAEVKEHLRQNRI